MTRNAPFKFTLAFRKCSLRLRAWKRHGFRYTIYFCLVITAYFGIFAFFNIESSVSLVARQNHYQFPPLFNEISEEVTVKNTNVTVNRSTFDRSNRHDVRRLKKLDKYKIFYNVCIHSSNPRIKYRRVSKSLYWYVGKEKLRLPERHCHHPQKKIEVHGAVRTMTKKVHGFNVKFRVGGIRKIYDSQNSTAYFLGYDQYFVPENFFHFTKQFIYPLHHLASKLNQLKPGAFNVPFYHQPWGRCPGRFSKYRTKYIQERFFRMLYVDTDKMVSAFEDNPNPDRVCYKRAVFTSSLFTADAHDAIRYIQGQIGIDRKNCTKGIVIIIKRKTRRILNENELLQAALSTGYDTRLVAFEELSLEEQVQLVYCAEILIGVTGAGLQWAYFMKPNSSVVEIAWPHYEWPFFFSSNSSSYNSGERIIMPLNFFQIAVKNCKIDADRINSYMDESFHVKANLSRQVRLAIIQDARNYNFRKSRITSLGKLCDVYVDPMNLKDVLLKIKATINH